MSEEGGDKAAEKPTTDAEQARRRFFLAVLRRPVATHERRRQLWQRGPVGCSRGCALQWFGSDAGRT